MPKQTRFMGAKSILFGLVCLLSNQYALALPISFQDRSGINVNSIADQDFISIDNFRQPTDFTKGVKEFTAFGEYEIGNTEVTVKLHFNVKINRKSVKILSHWVTIDTDFIDLFEGGSGSLDNAPVEVSWPSPQVLSNQKYPNAVIIKLRKIQVKEVASVEAFLNKVRRERLEEEARQKRLGIYEGDLADLDTVCQSGLQAMIVKIRSTPTGASLWVNGGKVEAVSNLDVSYPFCTDNLGSESFTIELKKSGWIPCRREIVVASRPKTLKCKLQKL